MKQTAVEWLIEQIIKYRLVPEGTHPDNVLFHKAKEMENEQIIDAFVECWKSNVPDGVQCKLDAEQYYNETYESNT